MPLCGNIEPFHTSDLTWDVYEDCLKHYLIAQDVKESRKLSTVLSIIGGKTYSILRNLLLPASPDTKSLDEIFNVLRKHFCPRPSTVAERYRFFRRFQKEGESFSNFVADLRQMTQFCKWSGPALEENICNQFIVGLRNDDTKQRLFREMDATLEEALTIANAYELSSKDAKEINPTGSNSEFVQQVSKDMKKQKSAYKSYRLPDSKNLVKCKHCGEKSHNSEHCRYSEATCFKCKRKGHLMKICTSRDSVDSTKQKFRQTKNITSDEELVTYSLDHVKINEVKGQSEPYVMTLNVNGIDLQLEIDTGAAVTILPEHLFNKFFSNQVLSPPGVVLRSYTGEKQAPVGKFDATVKFRGKIFNKLEVFVVKQVSKPLLGRSWIERLELLNIINTLAVKMENSIGFNKAKKDRLEVVLKKYNSLFDGSLGTILGAKAHFSVKDASSPKFFKARPVPFALKRTIEEELIKLEKMGIISPIKYSEWAAPVVPVIKKDGSIRLCGDYKVGLNPVLNVDFYPLPKIEEMFSQLSGGVLFSKLDLAQAYLQIEIDEGSKQYTVINTIRGLYRVNRLPFGVASAPAIFQRAMEQVISGLKGVMCYLDDLLVTGSTVEEHFQNLESLLARLDESGIKLNKAKCNFLQDSVEYLGHVIDSNGLHASPSKIQAIIDAPNPKNVTELRSFLGLINYYRKFLPLLSSVLAPLNTLLQKDKVWDWSPNVKAAFHKAKELITSSDVLIHFNPDWPVVLACDASSFGLGAVISHTLPDGSERPIAFASRSLSSSEKKYAQIDKEALGIIFGVRRFHQFLFGRKFTLITDHQPLTRIFGPFNAIPTLAASRLQRWALILASYNYDIVYKNTKLHGNADGLSRSPPPFSLSTKIDEEENPVDIHLISQIELFPVDYKAIAKATVSDSILSKVLKFTQSGWPTSVEKELQPYFNKKEEISIQQGCLLWGIRVIIPRKWQPRVLQELHLHHTGTVKMKMLSRGYFWWSGLDEDINNITKSCPNCMTQTNQPSKAPLHPWVWPTRPGQRLHVDFAGPFQGVNFLVAVDAHSKWPEVYTMGSTTTEKTIEVLGSIMSRFGIPEHIVTDNGSQFISKDFQTFCKVNGIKHTRSAPYHPSTNGQAERFVQVLKRNILKCDRGQTLIKKLNQVLFSYRTTPHSTTHETPAFLFLGRQLRTRLDLLRPSTESTVHRSQDRQVVKREEKKVENKSLSIGQSVMARVYAHKDKWTPATVIEQSGPVSYQVKLDSGIIWKRHRDQLVPTLLTPSTGEFTTLCDEGSSTNQMQQ